MYQEPTYLPGRRKGTRLLKFGEIADVHLHSSGFQESTDRQDGCPCNCRPHPLNEARFDLSRGGEGLIMNLALTRQEGKFVSSKLPEDILRDLFAMPPAAPAHKDYGIFSVATGNSTECIQAVFAIGCLKAAQCGRGPNSIERSKYLHNIVTKTTDAAIGEKFIYVITEGVPNLSLTTLAEYALLKSWEIRPLHPSGDQNANTGNLIRSNSPANTMFINIRAPQDHSARESKSMGICNYVPASPSGCRS